MRKMEWRGRKGKEKGGRVERGREKRGKCRIPPPYI